MTVSQRLLRRRRVLSAVGVLAIAGSFAVATTSTAATKSGAKHHVLLVCNGTVKCPKAEGARYYKSLQLAVDRAGNGDTILVWPGLYKESVTVQPGHGFSHDLHIIGMNRNGVVFDGKKTGGSAVHVIGAKDTWVENMTGQHYLTGSANAFYWTGVDGYWGNYLTAYDNGDYGIYAYDSTSSGKTPATFAFDYGSWNADSGIYIGGCRDCNAVITNSQAEHNPLGYSGTNAGGELYILNSEFDHNAAGITPNSLTSEPDLPQDGIYIANNYVHDNNDKNVPGSGITNIAPVGVGIEIAGGNDDIIRDNLITNQKHQGVILHWLYTPTTFNQVVSNTFKHDGYGGTPGDADIANDVTGVMNCFDYNVDITGGKSHPATVDPPNIANLENCGGSNPGRKLPVAKGIYEIGDPIVTIETLLNAVGITEKKDYKGPGKRPSAQKTMPDPCKGVPDNAWCAEGKPVFKAPSHS
ncbi:MAG TPA: right-handed parallel beta-helix repeat-containing protein [Mycobacteriales bacterium]|nr:right-handed parallel beta-helix repeat-containing protein [Mycobacteriales bacterium]